MSEANLSRSALIIAEDLAYGDLVKLFEPCGICASFHPLSKFDSEVAEGCDLVVLEGVEPGGRPLQLVSKIRATGARLVVIVSSTDPGFVCDLYRSGADIVFGAGTDAYHVFLQCCTFLRIWQVHNRPSKIGGALFEAEHRRLRLPNGSCVQLTEAESKILSLLVARPDAYVGRHEISNTVFKIPYDKFDRRIDVHVSNLRKKLRQNEIGIAIDTSRSNGFRILLDEDDSLPAGSHEAELAATG